MLAHVAGAVFVASFGKRLDGNLKPTKTMQTSAWTGNKQGIGMEAKEHTLKRQINIAILA